MDAAILWRVALVQTVAVAALSLALAVVLPDGFFGMHWLGAAVAVGLLAILSAQLPRPEASRT